MKCASIVGSVFLMISSISFEQPVGRLMASNNHSNGRRGLTPALRAWKVSSSLKPLKSVAHNVCHQFASTLNYWAGDYGINHFARSVVAAGNLVAVDLLAGTSHPALSGEGAAGVRQLAVALPSFAGQRRLRARPAGWRHGHLSRTRAAAGTRW